MANSFSLSVIPNYVIPHIATFCTHLDRYYHTASPGVAWIDKKVMVLTEVLPKPAAYLTYHLWKSTPYIIGSIILPSSLYFVALGVAALFYVFTTPVNQTPDLSPVITGGGFSYVICGIGSIAAGSITHNSVTSITGIFQIVFGGGCLYYSGFISRFVQFWKGRQGPIQPREQPIQEVPPLHNQEPVPLSNTPRAVSSALVSHKNPQKRIPEKGEAEESFSALPVTPPETSQRKHKQDRPSLIERCVTRVVTAASKELLSIPLETVLKTH